MRCLGLLALAACGGSGHTTDIKPTLRFADLDVATIERLVFAARGMEVDAAAMTLSRYGTSCPTTSVSGDTTTYLGGCATSAGMMISGSASRTQGSLSHGQFDAWTIGATSYSGIADWSQVPVLRGDCDLTVDVDGVVVRSDLAYACHPESYYPEPGCDNECSWTCASQGSGVELVAAGGALISGTWSYVVGVDARPGNMKITLRGADTLTATASGWQIAP